MTTTKKQSTRTKKIGKNKEVTPAEFKTWLEGVESMQDDNWHPNETQWRKIRDKISQIQSIVANKDASPPLAGGLVVHEATAETNTPQPKLLPTQQENSLLVNSTAPILTPKNPLNVINADGFVDASPKQTQQDGTYESLFGS